MKIKLLILMCVMSVVHLNAMEVALTKRVLSGLGNVTMPATYWGYSRGEFSTLEDAFTCAKINALYFGLEHPNGTEAVGNFESAITYCLSELSAALPARREEITFYISKIQGDNEGVVLQDMATQLRKRIDEQGKSFRLYNEWLQRNKNSDHTRNILNYIDTYFKTKNEKFVEEFFYFLQTQVVVDVAQLEELAK